MTDHQNPFSDFPAARVIELRWTLRDIKARRMMLLPVSDDDLTILTGLGLVEVQNGLPVITPAGIATLE